MLHDLASSKAHRPISVTYIIRLISSLSLLTLHQYSKVPVNRLPVLSADIMMCPLLSVVTLTEAIVKATRYYRCYRKTEAVIRSTIALGWLIVDVGLRDS